MKQKLIVLLLCLAITTAFLGCQPEPTPQPVEPEPITEEPMEPEEPQRRNITIIGSEEFKTDIQDALNLIYERTPEFYEDIEELVTLIRLVELSEEDHKSAGWANSYGNIIVTDYLYDWLVSNPDDFTLPEYELASTIVHETTHIRQGREGREAKGLEAEREALAVERAFLEALGASPEDIEAVAGEHLLDNPWWEE